MRSFGRALGRLLLILVGLGMAFWVLAPRERIETMAPVTPDLADPGGWLAAREAAFDDLTPGTQAQIIWAGADNIPTETVILYIHGFSASPAETRPMPDQVAQALGANLVFARLPGHGRSGDAMAEPRAGDWVADIAAMLQIARSVGEDVVVMGVSTGATLASYIATDPVMAADVAAYVLISPNYVTANPTGALLEWPLARVWVPWIAGAERRFVPQNEDHGIYWTVAYPTQAMVTMGTLLRETRAQDYSGIAQPALFVFADTDSVVSAPAIRDFAAGWGGPKTLIPVAVPLDDADPDHHVLAGDILSPALTERMVENITDWLRDTLS